MLTKKLTCGECGWQGYKSLDMRRLHHRLVCPECKALIDLDLSAEEIAWTEATRRVVQSPQVYQVKAAGMG